MAVTKEPRGNGSVNGSGGIKYIDGIAFIGLGSGGFDPTKDFVFTGDELDNFIEGGDGHDELIGNGGNDVLREGLNNGILKGGEGNDDLDGQQGTEKLFGGPGNDILRAGYGYDRLNGGEGNDTFGFYAEGHFQVADFTIGQDRLFFDSTTLGITQLSELVPYITKISDITNDAKGGTRFDFGPNASIELVGIKLADLTAEMIVFHL
ncbi:MAG: hemolysin expression modulating protein [Nitrosomonas sp.]